jgi:hypothetical protein
VLAALHHPGLVVLFDAQLTAQPPFLTMEYVAGESLHTRIARPPRLTAAETVEIIRDVASALAVVHEHGVIHRDVKPANILLPAAGGTAKLADFGIARLAAAEGLTATGTVLGTAAYVSPEQASGAPVAASSDIYSLGLVFIEALTGTRPFDGTAIEAAAARLARDPDLSADELTPYRSLLTAMTARDPAARPTAAEVIANLDGATATRALSAATQPLAAVPTLATVPLADDAAPAAAGRPPRARLVAVAAGAALVGGLAIAAAALSLPHTAFPAGAGGRLTQGADATHVVKVMPAGTETEPSTGSPGNGPAHPPKPDKHHKPGKPDKPGKPGKPGKGP